MKLNLGSGSKILDGYTNVDKFDYYKPDVAPGGRQYSQDRVSFAHVRASKSARKQGDRRRVSLFG